VDAPSHHESSYDPVGTSHAFSQLEFYATALSWNFDEQIAKAPAALLEEWRSQLVEAETSLVDVKHHLGITA
jgi:hypothetical protein